MTLTGQCAAAILPAPNTALSLEASGNGGVTTLTDAAFGNTSSICDYRPVPDELTN